MFVSACGIQILRQAVPALVLLGCGGWHGNYSLLYSFVTYSVVILGLSKVL
jgi:hypothetical protein